MRVTFDEVSVTAVRYEVIEGKRRKRQKRFWQTVNPWNQRADGTPKNRDEVLASVQAEAYAWTANVNQ